MNYKFESVEESVWSATSSKTNYPTLDYNNTTIYDLVIVGWWITWISAAYYAQQAWLSVALVERYGIVEWTTGGTTAKLTAQHYLIYHELIKRHGREVAQAYADANIHGIDEIEHIGQKLNIDSDFARKDAYIFTKEDDKVGIIKEEVGATQSLWLPSSFETTIDLPYTITWAIKYTNQAQFHPRKYLLPLAEYFVNQWGMIYENTTATDIVPGEIATIITEKWSLKAKFVIEASSKPFWKPKFFENKYRSKVSYWLAVELQEDSYYPKNLYLTTDEPLRTTRSMPWENDKQLMIFGWESHNANDWDPEPHYEILEREVRQIYPVKKIHYRWLADDLMPYDKIPFIGLMPGHNNIYVSTWYRARGLARWVAAAEAIVQAIIWKPLKWMQYFNLERLLQATKDEDKIEKV